MRGCYNHSNATSSFVFIRRMLNRFDGADGHRRLADALSRQTVVNGDHGIAELLIGASDLIHYEAGYLLIADGHTDSDVFFILAGRVAVEIRGLEVAIRAAGTHVGEMAALDPAAPRSANVRVLEPTTVLRISEDRLTAIATDHPELWRRFAIELSDRLRQRTRFFRTPNDRPRLFVGSSTEMLPVSKAIQAALDHYDVRVTVWTDGVFRASKDAVTSLLAVAERTDVAVLIFGPDDTVLTRGDERAAPRDNVVFELGLFVGAVGRNRTFIVKARGVDLKLPTDLLGIEPLQFSSDERDSLTERIAPVCTEILDYVRELGVR